jgi:hypothetical protein
MNRHVITDRSYRIIHAQFNLNMDRDFPLKNYLGVETRPIVANFVAIIL